KGWANDEDNPRRSGDALALAIKDSRNRLLFQSQAPSAPTAPITFLLARSPFWVIANTAAIARQHTTSCYYSGLGPISSRLFTVGNLKRPAELTSVRRVVVAEEQVPSRSLIRNDMAQSAGRLARRSLLRRILSAVAASALFDAASRPAAAVIKISQ